MCKKSLTNTEVQLTRAREEFQKLVKRVQDAHRDKVRIDQLEKDLLSKLMAIGLGVLTDFVEAAGDGNLGAEICHQDQDLKRSPTPVRRTYRSIFGAVEIKRYVYSVRAKTKAIFKPLDQQLGLPADDVSYVLESWLGKLSVDVPFEVATAFLKSTLGIEAQASTAQRRVFKLGAYVEDFNEQRPAITEQPEQEICVALGDGISLPVRTSFEQRAKDALGKAPTKRPDPQKNYPKSRYRNVLGDKKTQRATVGAFYSIEAMRRSAQEVINGDSSSNIKPVNKRLWGELNLITEQGISRGAQRVFESLSEEWSLRDPEKKKPLVCLMDGDRHLWSLCEEYLPGAIQILDLFHVMERLWLAAHCFHPEASLEAEQWVAKYLKMLLENKVDNVRSLLRRWINQGGLGKTKREHLESVHRYFTVNRSRMQYGRYLQAGFPIGSGVIEGACKHVVKDRMCGTGMTWEYEGAQHMLNLRVTKLNNQWEDLMQFRIKEEQHQLYATAC